MFHTIEIDNQKLCANKKGYKRGVFVGNYGNLPLEVAKYQKYSRKLRTRYTCCGGNNIITWKRYRRGAMVLGHAGTQSQNILQRYYPDCTQ